MRRTERAAGFTLLEILVALAVLAIALAAAIRAVAGVSGNQHHLQQRQLAHWVAQNRIAELQLRPRRADSGEIEMAGQRWYWQRRREATDDPQLQRWRLSVAVATSPDSPLVTLVAYGVGR